MSANLSRTVCELTLLTAGWRWRGGDVEKDGFSEQAAPVRSKMEIDGGLFQIVRA
jgi:hypothetical protein